MVIKINKFVILSFWMFFAYCMAQFYNPLHITSNIYKFNKAFYYFPQGWGFFTKDPQEQLVKVYRIDQDNVIRVDYNNGSAENFFGLSKKARYNLIESGTMYAKIKNSKSWQKNKGVLDPQRHLSLPSDTIKYNPKFENFSKGSSFVFLRYKTVPFAWSLENQEQNIPYEVIKIYIR